jgi:LssY-like putative type I secretion system component LssY
VFKLKWIVLLIAVVSTVAVEAGEIPAGTRLSVRLRSPISSHHSKAGDRIRGVLVAPVVDGDRVLIPAGATVRGAVREAARKSRNKGRPTLWITFDRLEAGGAEIPMQSRVIETDNARESVDEEGMIVGLQPRNTRPGKVAAVLLVASRAHWISMAAVAGMKLYLKKADRPAIHYDPGVEMTLELSRPMETTWASGQRTAEYEPKADLARVIERQPLRTVEPGRGLADWTNLLFVGTREQLTAAFHDAGWTPASRLCFRSRAKAFVALSIRHPYREGPVSTLLLDGRRPDMVFQKQNNTFAKRHHIRIWKQAERLGENEVWIGAATHDVGIAFSREERRFTHITDPAIDRERAKVVADLEFSGYVENTSLLSRSRVPAYKAGDAVETDGRIAVVALRQPVQAQLKAPAGLLRSSSPELTQALLPAAQ